MSTAAALQLSVKGNAVGVLTAPNKILKDHVRALVTADEARELLEEKLSSRYKSVRQAFCRFDEDVDGFISDSEFRVALVHMGLDMTSAEYKKLWRFFDRNGDGKISYHEFNNRVGVLIHPKSDLVLNRPETPKVKEWQKKAIARGLRKKLHDIEAAFREIDSDSSGRISHQEFIQLLRRLGLAKVGHEESYQMMQRHRAKDNFTGEMTFEEFKSCMMEFMHIPADEEEAPDFLSPRSKTLNEVEKILADKLFSKFGAVQRAFRSFDEDKSGDLSYSEFKRALRLLNMDLTEDQFAAFVKRFDPSGDGAISYEHFNRVLGPIIHPEARDSSRAMLEMEERSGAQSGLVYNPTARLGANLPQHLKATLPHTGRRNSVIGDLAPPPPPPIEEDEGDQHQYAAQHASSTQRWAADEEDEEAHHGSAAAGGVAASAAARGASFSGSASVTSAAAARPASVGGAGAAGAGASDANAVEEKIRRTLGRDWVHAAAAVRKAATSAGGGVAVLSSEGLRDSLAEAGVPLTSRDASALLARYPAAGRPGLVDVDRFLKSAFRASFAGAPTAHLTMPKGGLTQRMGSATARPAPHSLRRDPPPPLALGPGPSAFIRPGTGGGIGVNIF